MKPRRAHAVCFGFDFQRNAAIILLLENIKELQAVRLEGNDEDIELTLENGKKILAQAKAIVNSSFDFKHVRENLKKALVSLSDGSQKIDVQQLIFITNSPNPFRDDDSKSIFSGLPTRRNFSNLPPSAQAIIKEYLDSIESPIDIQKFLVQVFPFETDDETERYKAVRQAVNDFIGDLKINTPGLGKRLLQVWQNDIFINSTKKEATLQFGKKDIIWPIIVFETEVSNCDDDIAEELGIGDYDEIIHMYGDIINSCCERIEFFTKILSDYMQFSKAKGTRVKQQEFINTKWTFYKDEFLVEGIDEESLEAITKIVLYNVIRRRRTIDKIKQGVNL